MNAAQAQAMIRFGLGRRGYEPLPADPATWLREQIMRPDPSAFPGVSTTSQCLATWRLDTQQPVPPAVPTRMNQLLASEKIQQMNNALVSTAPFRERLVWFWTNHFAIKRPDCWPHRTGRGLQPSSWSAGTPIAINLRAWLPHWLSSTPAWWR